METLNIVVSEILLCLVLAWILGFLAAWILFRKVQKEYEQEIEELEENLSFISASNKIQEKELIAQELKLQELSVDTIESIDTIEINEKKNNIKIENPDENILKRIEDNLYMPTKK